MTLIGCCCNIETGIQCNIETGIQCSHQMFKKSSPIEALVWSLCHQQSCSLASPEIYVCRKSANTIQNYSSSLRFWFTLTCFGAAFLSSFISKVPFPSYTRSPPGPLTSIVSPTEGGLNTFPSHLASIKLRLESPSKQILSPLHSLDRDSRCCVILPPSGNLGWTFEW